MSKHWTSKNLITLRDVIAFDFVNDVMLALDYLGISTGQLARALKWRKKYLSKVISDPGPRSLQKLINLAKGAGQKVSLVLYDDNDPNNIHGPINPQVFRACWEACGKPRLLEEVREIGKKQ